MNLGCAEVRSCVDESSLGTTNSVLGQRGRKKEEKTKSTNSVHISSNDTALAFSCQENRVNSLEYLEHSINRTKENTGSRNRARWY